MSNSSNYLYGSKEPGRSNRKKAINTMGGLMTRSKEQNKALHTLLGSLGWTERKAELVEGFTDGRTDHSSEMTVTEADRMIHYLKEVSHHQSEECQRKRRSVISNLKAAGYMLLDGSADMKAIYAWALKQKHKKPLNDLNSSELSDLIHASRKVKEHFISTM